MFHEILTAGGLGIRTNGKAPASGIVRLEGDPVLGDITLDNCRDIDTIVGGSEFWPEVSVPSSPPPHSLSISTAAYTKNDTDQTVEAGVTWVDPTLDGAANSVNNALDQRWHAALDRGVPSTFNATNAVLRYNEVDRTVWGTYSPGMTPPIDGLLVALQEPLGGKDQYAIKGAPKLDQAKQDIMDHVNDASLAWERGRDDVADIVAGTGYFADETYTEAEKVLALANYNIETLGGRTELPDTDPEYAKGWPANENA